MIISISRKGAKVRKGVRDPSLRTLLPLRLCVNFFFGIYFERGAIDFRTGQRGISPQMIL
jgi:hypothetical protein